MFPSPSSQHVGYFNVPVMSVPLEQGFSTQLDYVNRLSPCVTANIGQCYIYSTD